MLIMDVRDNEEIRDLFRNTIGKVADAIAMSATDPPDSAKEFQCSAVAINALANVLAMELVVFLRVPEPASVEEGSATVKDLARCILGAAEEWANGYIASRN